MIKRLKLLIAMVLSAGCLSLVATPGAAAFDLFGGACEGNSNATVCEDASRNQTQSNNSLYGPGSIVATIVNILTIIIGVAAVIVIIVAGIQYMLSTGDPTKVNNAKNAILYAIAGLVVAVLAQVIVRFVVSRL